MYTIRQTTPADADFQTLVHLLDQEIARRDGDDHPFFAQFNKSDSIPYAVVCYADGKPIGCGAFKPYNDSQAEVKRMFVLPEYRGKGAATTVLKALEMWMAQAGYTGAVLETGTHFPEAVALYTKNNYQRIPNYGQYIGVALSICMQKQW